MALHPASVRWLRTDPRQTLVACSRCQAQGCPWDRIGGQAICPDCQQLILLGETEPLRLVPIDAQCAVCRQTRVLRFETSPLRSDRLLEVDLCLDHLEALLGRRLSPRALHRLTRLLDGLILSAKQIFLLHESFYDPHGRALQPVPEVI